MVHRPGGADFAPGAYVFPGGTVHEGDAAWGDVIAAAAIRELFEETGVLLARRGEVFARDPDCDGVRHAVEGGASFGDALRRLELDPALDALTMFARWVTPKLMRRRYDARFYLARMPSGQTIRPQEGEITDWLWIAAAEALASERLTLVYATRAVLESVADAPDATSLFERARHLDEIPIVEPRIVETEQGWDIVR
jgi:8-oxo-dGTP pyrophosphatase MutT (NUDIX family)